MYIVWLSTLSEGKKTLAQVMWFMWWYIWQCERSENTHAYTVHTVKQILGLFIILNKHVKSRQFADWEAGFEELSKLEMHISEIKKQDQEEHDKNRQISVI